MKNFITLVSTETLAQQINNPLWVIIDCRFSLSDPDAGHQAYRWGHIPNAHYAHLDKDLSSAITSTSGRHPLPDCRVLVKKLGLWGISSNTQVVIYDDASGAFAGRLWWLLRCLGHDSAAVLDGGISQWKKQGQSLTTTLPPPADKNFRAYVNQSCWLSASELTNQIATKNITLIDARTAERFSGKHEPIDPVAGHIPSAINRAFQLNLDENGLFLSRNKLRQQFKKLVNSHSPEKTIHMCGSGVTACHNLLAMEHAGLFGSRLYAGSWSEWITNRNRPLSAA